MSFTLGDIYLTFKARTGEVDAAFDRVDGRAAAFANATRNRLLSRFTGDTRGLDDAAGRAEGTLRGFGDRVRAFLTQSLTIPAGNFMGGMVHNIVSTVKGAVIGMNSSLETSEIQFKTLLGDADKAKAHVAMLFKFAKDTPFETEPIIRASRTLETFGGAALNNVQQLTLAGNAAAATSEDISRVAFWFGQLYTNVQGGTPFGQATITMQEMGIMAPEVRTKLEEMQKAGASATDIWAYFTKSMGKFDGAMIDQAKTWKGLTSTISDGLQMLGAQAGRPIFDLAKVGLTAFANALSSPLIPAAGAAVASVLQMLIDTAGQLLSPIGAVIALLSTGDFKGGLFGLTEDSPVVTGLLRIHALLARVPALWKAVTFGFESGGITGALLEVVTELFGIEARFGPMGDAIQRFDGIARDAFGGVRLFVQKLWADISPIAARLLSFGQTRIFPALMNDLAGLTPVVAQSVQGLLGLGEAVGGRVAAAVQTGAAALGRLGAMLTTVGRIASMAFMESGGQLGPAVRVFFTLLGQQIAAAGAGLRASARQLAGNLVSGLTQYIPEGLRGALPLILGGITSVLAGLSVGPALAGLFAGLAPVLAPVGALLAPLGGLLLGFGRALGGLRALLPGLGAGFRSLLNPIGLLRAGFGNLFTFLGVTGLKMVAVVANPLGALKLLFTGFGPALLGLKNPIGMLLGLGRTVLGLFSPLGILITLVSLFAGAFATNFGGIQEIVATTLGPVLPILLELGRILNDSVMSALMGDWPSAFAILTGGFAMLTPLLQQAGQTFQAGIPQIFGVLMQFLGQIGASVIGAIGQYLPGIITRLGTWATAFIAWVIPMIPPLLAAVGQMLGQLLDALGAALPGIVASLALVGAQFVAWVGPQIPPLLLQLGGLLASLLGWIAERAPGVLAQLGTWGLQLIGWIAPQIPPLLLALGGLLGAFLGWIVEKAPAVLTKLGVWATQFAVWARDEAGPKLVAALGTMFTTLWTELQRLWGAAFADGALGASLIAGLKKGIQDGWASFSSWFVTKLTAMIPDWARGPLGIQDQPAPTPAPPGGGGGTVPNPPGRATGGDVKKGKRYIVGEDGPEYFIAPADGQIEPNAVYEAVTNPVAAVAGALGWASRPAPRLPAAAVAVTSASAGAAGSNAAPQFHFAFTLNNPVVDTAERLEQLKRELLQEAEAQFTAAVNRLTLSGV